MVRVLSLSVEPAYASLEPRENGHFRLFFRSPAWVGKVAVKRTQMPSPLPISRAPKGPLLSLMVEPPKGSLTVEPAYASLSVEPAYLGRMSFLLLLLLLMMGIYLLLVIKM